MFHRLHIQMTFFSALIIALSFLLWQLPVISSQKTAHARMRGMPFRTTPSPVSLIWKRRVSSAVTGFCRQKKIMIFPWISETTEILFIWKNYRRILWMKRFSGRQKKSLLLPMHLIFPIPVRSVNWQNGSFFRWKISMFPLLWSPRATEPSVWSSCIPWIL